jgi:hypothetical protein
MALPAPGPLLLLPLHATTSTAAAPRTLAMPANVKGNLALLIFAPIVPRFHSDATRIGLRP